MFRPVRAATAASRGGDNCQKHVLNSDARQPPESLQHDGDNDGFDAIQHMLNWGKCSKCSVSPRANRHHQHRRKNERCAGDYEPSSAGSLMADMNGHFGRARTRNEVGRPQHVKEFRMGNPAAPLDELLFHHRDMCCRSAERDRAQAQERQSDWLSVSVPSSSE
jgi:hypothetical protein